MTTNADALWGTTWRGHLSPQVAEAMSRLLSEQFVLGSTPDEEFNIIAGMVVGQQSRRILQLGTYLGYSAMALGDLAAANGGSVLSVDPEKAYLECAAFYTRLAGLGNVEYLLGKSQDQHVVDRAMAEKWDMIFIDTTHHYLQTVLELDIYAGRVAGPETLILMHDASVHATTFDTDNRGGVRAALREWLARHDDWQGMICEEPVFPARCGVGMLCRKS